MARKDEDEVDSFPFDRPHWVIAVSFPVEFLDRKDALMKDVERAADMRGGAFSMMSQPAPGFVGKPGYETFSFAVAFEAGDENLQGFKHMICRDLGKYGVSTHFDPEDIIFPAPQERCGLR